MKEYYHGRIVWDCINECDLNFNLGNVVKYCCRAGKKEGSDRETDLKKALDYLEDEIRKEDHERTGMHTSNFQMG